MKIDVDPERLLLRLKELVDYDGYLPLLLRMRMSIMDAKFTYMKNLRGKGFLDKEENVDKFIKSKTFTWDDTIDEFKEWIKNHPEFKDLVIYIDDDSYVSKIYEIPESHREWVCFLRCSEPNDRERVLQGWYAEDPEHFNEWLELAKYINGSELFEGTSFE